MRSKADKHGRISAIDRSSFPWTTIASPIETSPGGFFHLSM
jgi:hypothetical protein